MVGHIAQYRGRTLLARSDGDPSSLTALKAQMEIQRLSQITQKAQKDFTDTVEKLTKKYVVDPATWLFDNVELVFKKK